SVDAAVAISGRSEEGVRTDRTAGEDQHPPAEMLAVVVRVALVSQDPGHRVELGVGDVDPISIGTGWIAIDGQHGLVFERKSATCPCDVGALDHRPAREVPRGAPVSGGPEDVDGAGAIEVR